MAVCVQAAAIFVAPSADSAELGYVAVGESVTVTGWASSGNWLCIRDGDGIEGFVWKPYFDWPGDFQALPTCEPTESSTSPVDRGFRVEYLGCQPHAMKLGSVKGQVFDRRGNVISGAQVEIWIDGSRWNNPANPARTNQDGWYEWILGLHQTVRFVALYVDGGQVTIYPQDLEVSTMPGCFQHVNFRQR